MQTKTEIQQSNEILHFKSNDIENSIKKYGYFKNNSITIYQLLDFDDFIQQDEYIPPNEDLFFALENKDDKIPFLGIVNFNFKRFGYCLNAYINGDIYFGNYYKDVISKKGFYSYKPEIENDYKLSQYYYGFWENNLFEGNGIYLWIKEPKDILPFSNIDISSFDAFIGNSEKGQFKKGVLLNYKGINNFFIYYGSFSNDGKKEGKNCFYYCSTLEEICFGNYNNGIFYEGFVGKFNKDTGNINNLIFYKKEENENPEGKRIKVENEKNVVYIMNKFRKIVLTNNFAKNIFDEFKQILKFRDEKMKDINTIINNNQYEEIIKLFTTEKINLYQELEKNFGI